MICPTCRAGATAHRTVLELDGALRHHYRCTAGHAFATVERVVDKPRVDRQQIIRRLLGQLGVLTDELRRVLA